MLPWRRVTLKGAWVFVGSRHCGSLLALAMAGALVGCSNFDTTGSWFSKPLDVFGQSGGYRYAQLDQEKRDRPITANDVVDASGACPTAAAAQSAVAAPGESPAEPGSLLGGGIAIGMSECDVVARVGSPTAFNLGRNPNGDRSAVMTFKSGPRPGIYRFVAGRLTEMDRVEEPPPPPPPPAKKKAAKKTPVKSEKPKKPANNT